MRRLLLEDAWLEDPAARSAARGSLVLESGRIAARLAPGEEGPGDARTIPLGGLRLSPGLLDLHFHGEAVVRPAHDAAASLRRASASLARHGVTGFLPTTLAWPPDELAARVDRLVEAIGDPVWPGAQPLGLHLEGPWIRAEAAGAQPPGGIRAIDAREVDTLLAAAAGAVRMVTLAPELEGALELVERLDRAGIVPALGHSRARSAEVFAAAAAGARHVTHLFNAMGPLHHREPGLAAAALADDRLGCDLIADGAHVHPDWVRVAARAKGEHLVLISDRVDPAGEERGSSLGGVPIRSDGVAWRLPDGRLAGSQLALDDAIRNVVAWRVMTRLDALAACTLRPARLLGVEAARGTLRTGARADLVLWSEAGDVLATWVGGRLVHRAPAAPQLD